MQTIAATTQSPTSNNMILGLVAGEGKLPGILARSAKNGGYKVIAAALSEKAQAALVPHCDKVFLIAPGQIGRNLSIMKRENVQNLVFIGNVPKMSVLQNIHKFDWTAIKELSKMPDFNDVTIHRGVANLMEENGIKVLTQSEFLRELFPHYGVMTKRQPTVAEYADVEIGMRVAREIARLDIGQTVVMRNQLIIAVEGIDGTDATIKRAVQITRGPVVVCKVARPVQDQRFDIPAVGMNTLQSIVAPNPGGVLAIGAGETLVVEREEMVAFADAHDMSILAV